MVNLNEGFNLLMIKSKQGILLSNILVKNHKNILRTFISKNYGVPFEYVSDNDNIENELMNIFKDIIKYPDLLFADFWGYNDREAQLLSDFLNEYFSNRKLLERDFYFFLKKLVDENKNSLARTKISFGTIQLELEYLINNNEPTKGGIFSSNKSRELLTVINYNNKLVLESNKLPEGIQKIIQKNMQRILSYLKKI